MLRWRPELPAEQRRQRRDWVFLFEASGDRDPLLGRVQVDVIKTVLENAEHDDTFSIVTAGTRTHALRAEPQAATPENVERAVKFLEQTHLVGALDLARALRATGPFVEAAENPVLVHVGSGVPVLGTRDVDALVRRIPKGTRYVGVGVGKRWSRTLMKTAAGCANSTGFGAKLAATGTATIGNDSVVLAATESTPNQPGLFFQGNNATGGSLGVTFGDGLRCAGGGVVRLQVRLADSSGNASSTVSVSSKGGVSAGQTKRYQWWYRDPTFSPCLNGFNLSNGVEISWN